MYLLTWIYIAFFFMLINKKHIGMFGSKIPTFGEALHYINYIEEAVKTMLD